MVHLLRRSRCFGPSPLGNSSGLPYAHGITLITEAAYVVLYLVPILPLINPVNVSQYKDFILN